MRSSLPLSPHRGESLSHMDLKPFTFPGSGVTVNVRRVPQQTMQDANASLPAPKPPIQEVELDGKIKKEPNYAHPEYLQALQDHQMDQMRLSQKLLVRLGIQHTLTDEDRAELARVLDVLKELGIKPTGDSELEQWVYYVAAPGVQDLSSLMEEVLGLSVPTPKSDSNSD